MSLKIMSELNSRALPMYNLQSPVQIYPTNQPASHPTNQPTNHLIASCTLDLTECFDHTSGNDFIWSMHLRISLINKITHSFLPDFFSSFSNLQVLANACIIACLPRSLFIIICAILHLPSFPSEACCPIFYVRLAVAIRINGINLTLPQDHLLLTVGFKSFYRMLMVSFYGKIQNDFVFGHKLTSFECVTHHQNVIFCMRTSDNSPILIELFRIVGVTCNFPAASFGLVKKSYIFCRRRYPISPLHNSYQILCMIVLTP